MPKKNQPVPADYGDLLVAVKERVRAAQYKALKSVNKELVGLYWDIGRMIVGRLTDDSWGKAVVQQLAADLQREFPGIGGFSASNLWRMKAFFEMYAGSEKLAPLVREISWSHNLIILERCSDPLEREFYLRMTRKFGWSKNVLAHQIENQSYEKTLLGQTNFDKALTPELRAQAEPEGIFRIFPVRGCLCTPDRPYNPRIRRPLWVRSWICGAPWVFRIRGTPERLVVGRASRRATR